MESKPVAWSLGAGLAVFLAGVVLMILLGPISNLLVGLLPFDARFAPGVLALPTLGIGTLVWWGSVECRASYTYLVGAGFGVLTALGTVVVWLSVFVAVWGPTLVLSGWLLIVLVAGITIPVAGLVGIAVLYARRRTSDRIPPSDAGSLSKQ